jgi:hypothetical protein
VGSPEDETDNLITGIAGHQVLKRLNKVQSINYNIDLPKGDAAVLGKSIPFSRKADQPAEVGLSIDYLLDGVNNEKRIGLNTDNENENSVDRNKSIVHDMATVGTKDKRNLYLVVNNKEGDIKQGNWDRDIIYTSDFSTDTDGWGQSNGTKSRVDLYGGETNVFRSKGNTTEDPHDAWKQYLFTVGKRYKISGKFYISGGSTTYKGMVIYLGSQSSYEGQKFHFTKTSSPWTPITIATWVDFEFEVIAGHENIYFYPVDTNGLSDFAATTSDEFGLKDIVVTEIYSTDIPHDGFYNGTFGELDVIDPNSADYSTVIFQNCYLTKYALNLEVGSLPNVSLDYVGENIVGYASGSGVNIPYLDLKKGEITNTAASVYTSDFSASKDEWEGISLSVLENYSSESTDEGFSLCARADTCAAGCSHYIRRDDVFEAGKKYKVSGKILIANTSANIDYVRVITADTEIARVTVKNSWESFSAEVAVSTAYDLQSLFFTTHKSNGSQIYTGGSTTSTYDAFYVADIVVTEVKEFIVPRNFSEAALYDNDFFVAHGDIGITISQTDLNYTSDWSKGSVNTTINTDGWVSDDELLANHDGVAGEDDTLWIRGQGTDGNHFTYKNGVFVKGEKYKISGKIYLESSSVSYKKVEVINGATCGENVIFSFDETLSDQWVTFEKEFVATQENLQVRYLTLQGATYICSFLDVDYTSAQKDSIYLKDFIITSLTQTTGFYDNHITSCSISSNFNRDKISYIGHKMVSDRPIQLPAGAELSFSTTAKDNISGSFLDDMRLDKEYNITVEFKHHPKENPTDNVLARYILSGAKFDGIDYSSAIGSNKTANMNFSTYMDLEAGRSCGLFISGKVTTAVADLITENGDNVTDNNSNEIISMPVYPQY